MIWSFCLSLSMVLKYHSFPLKHSSFCLSLSMVLKSSISPLHSVEAFFLCLYPPIKLHHAVVGWMFLPWGRRGCGSDRCWWSPSCPWPPHSSRRASSGCGTAGPGPTEYSACSQCRDKLEWETEIKWRQFSTQTFGDKAEKSSLNTAKNNKLSEKGIQKCRQ